MSVEADLTISSEASPRSAPQPAPVRWWVVGLVGVTGFLVGVWGSWIPPIWDDEGATILSATRSWESLARLVQSIDLVHAAYYSIMHVWFGWVGYSPFTLRLPSAFAVGAAAALMVVLIGRLASARVAVFAGLVLAVLPRATWAAVEGRSYAITVLLAVVMTLLFVVALDGATDTTRSLGNAVRWGAYAIVCVVAIVLFVYLALLVIAHGVAVLTLVILRRVGRRSVIGFALAAVAAAASTLPLVVALGREVGQVSWILPLSRETFGSVLVTQFYVNDRIVAAVATALIVVGVVILVRRRGVRPVARLRVTSRCFCRSSSCRRPSSWSFHCSESPSTLTGTSPSASRQSLLSSRSFLAPFGCDGGSSDFSPSPPSRRPATSHSARPSPTAPRRGTPSPSASVRTPAPAPESRSSSTVDTAGSGSRRSPWPTRSISPRFAT